MMMMLCAQKVTHAMYLTYCRALETKRAATVVLLRCLQMKWEQIDGDSILRKARRDIEIEKRAKDEAQRRRLAEAADAKRVAEEALNQRMHDEKEARDALEKGDKHSRALLQLSLSREYHPQIGCIRIVAR
jgi:hypothetical protein